MIHYFVSGDRCPMHFDDGSNPWVQTESHIHLFHFFYNSATSPSSTTTILSLVTCGLVAVLYN